MVVVIMSIWTMSSAPDCLLSILWWIKYLNRGFVIAQNQTISPSETNNCFRFGIFSFSHLCNSRYLSFFWFLIHFFAQAKSKQRFPLIQIIMSILFGDWLESAWYLTSAGFLFWQKVFCWIYSGKWQEFPWKIHKNQINEHEGLLKNCKENVDSVKSVMPSIDLKNRQKPLKFLN